jgi:lipoyl(octanoyl) transferase
MSGLRCHWLGRVAYADAVALQEALRRRLLDGDHDAERLLLLEHDPVITLGKSARREHLLATPELLAARGITVAESSRGGDVTYHGPGQLVAYPVMRLQNGVVAHVEALAQAVIDLAAAHGVSARFRRDCPGVWVDSGSPEKQEAKLAAFGVHVHRRVAIHGVAVNITTALSAFDLIVPCGLAGTRATSLAALTPGALPPLADLARAFASRFADAVGRAVDFDVASPIQTLLSQLAFVE